MNPPHGMRSWKQIDEEIERWVHPSRHDAVLRTTAWLRSGSYLTPDSELEALGEPALRWCQERLEEHLEVLQRLPVARGLELELGLFRDAWTAWEFWSDASKHCRSTEGRVGPTDRWRMALAEFREQTHSLFDAASKIPLSWLGRDVEYNIFTNLGVAEQLRLELPEKPWGRHRMGEPLHHTVGLHLEWKIVFGDNEPSPWEALLSIWHRGAWPFACHGGLLGVYVPVRSGDSFVWSPEREKQTLPEMQISWPGIGSEAEMGEGSPPGVLWLLITRRTFEQ